jgi:hypothetical protein
MALFLSKDNDFWWPLLCNAHVVNQFSSKIFF